MLFMLGGFVGAFLFGETESFFDGWYNNSGYHGRLTLDQVFGVPAGILVLLIICMALFMFWGAEQLERIIGKKDFSREPKIRKFGAVALFAGAAAVMLIGDPSIEDRYAKVSFKRTEMIQQGEGAPLAVAHTYTADEMLEKRLAFVSPAEAFKARFNQAVNPIYLDVRSEADYNLYHIANAMNVPLGRLSEVIPDLLSEPPANTVFVTISNDETAAIAAWKVLVGSGVQNAYILDGGVNNWIASFGKDDKALLPVAAADDQLKYHFPAALGSRYESCSPNPIEQEKLKFEPKIVLQLKRDKSGGGCG